MTELDEQNGTATGSAPAPAPKRALSPWSLLLGGAILITLLLGSGCG